MLRWLSWFGFGAALLLALATGIGGCGDDRPPYDPYAENAGSSCIDESDCYPYVDPGDIEGDIVCMDRVSGGYCTHTCTDDSDCCAADGECETGHPQVCAPFESTGQYYCFLSCESDDIGSYDESDYCYEFAHTSFSCRSTGGGSDNRKVCVP